MSRSNIRFMCAITVLSISIIACNLTNNFAGAEIPPPSESEVINPTSPVLGDSETAQVPEIDPDNPQALSVSPALDAAARQEVIALVSQTNPAPDLSQLPAEVSNCLANDAWQWEQEQLTIVTINDEYPSGQQKQVTCSLISKLFNASDENIIIIYNDLSYKESVEKPHNRRFVNVGEGTLPGGQIYFPHSFNDYPLDPAEGIIISTTLGFAAFYDRPECQAFIEDETLLQQLWQPLEYPCKDYLPTSSAP